MPMPRAALNALMALSTWAGAAQASFITVAFVDPAAQFVAYQADIARATVAAGEAWLQQFTPGPVPFQLNVSIVFAPIPTATGRSTSVAWLGTDSVGLRQYEQGAAHEIRTGIDINGSAADIEFTIGSSGYLQTELWFDPDPSLRLAVVPENRTDAVSVLMHEFGHALGFNGWRDGVTGALPGDYQSTYDAWVVNAATADDTGLYFTGPQATAQYGGPVPLTADSFAHLGNRSLLDGADLIPDLMNGIEFYRGTRYTISALDRAMLQDIGLPVVTAAVPEPAGAALLVLGLGVVLLARRRAAAVRPPSGLRARRPACSEAPCAGTVLRPHAAIGTRKSRLMPTPRSPTRSRNCVR